MKKHFRLKDEMGRTFIGYVLTMQPIAKNTSKNFNYSSFLAYFEEL
jgi:hypothetical protein